jgi:hypothetical protein
MHDLPVTLLIALAVQISCQIFKVIFYSIKNKKLSLSYFTTAGGIPSSHTAFVTALTTMIGIRHGIKSDLFAVSAVFTSIVVYDAFRLRGHVQNAAVTINKLITEHFPEENTKLSEMVGHTIPEIAAGLIFGIAAAGIAAAIIIQ